MLIKPMSYLINHTFEVCIFMYGYEKVLKGIQNQLTNLEVF
jgi:hypothetical protein